MPLGQIGNTHPSLYAFLCEFDALKESFLPLIFLHDSRQILASGFRLDDHRIANWCFQASSVGPILC